MVFNKVAGRKKFGASKERSNFESKSYSFGGLRNKDRNRTGSFEKKELHKAVCFDCGMDCKVPFIPTEGKSVFCSQCFTKQSPMDAKRPFQKSFDRKKFPERVRDNSFSSDGVGKQLKDINFKLEKVLESMEKIYSYLNK